MNIQEQLEKIEGEWKKSCVDIINVTDVIDYYNKETNKISDWWIEKIKSSALKLLKTAYEEERERLEKCRKTEAYQEAEKEFMLIGYNDCLTDTITHLNTKIAEVDRLLDNK